MSTVDRARIVYRKRREDDDEFLFRLYASTRADEMKMVPWTEVEKEQFLRMQFRAQTVYYDEHYDGDEFFVIERDGLPIGRLYLDQQPEDLRIVDIALLPEIRGAGLGTILLKEILDRAASSNLPVTIHVEHFNPAMHLYERLGFRHIDTNGVYHLMQWTADR